ncbi:hypothetical protein [Streptomyces sp.]|uniref:hypothetical protein n=1 Tax=Streptomyces sp. TaxID=1931 RepID=UPI002F3EA717
MTDFGHLTCEQFLDSGPELALGILPARERAAGIAHVQHCSACLEHVRQLVRTADGLLELIPGSEPPVGFETRALRRIGLSHPRQSRHRLLRRAALCAAAAATAFAAGVGGWAVGQTSGGSVPAAPATAEQPGGPLVVGGLAVSGQSVGRAFAYEGSPPWAYVSVDADHAEVTDGKVWCQIQRGDGSTAVIGSFPIADGYGQWGGGYQAGRAPVTGLRLLTADGSVVAATTFVAAKS